MPTNKELFETSPEYRAKIIRELEQNGTINKLNGREFYDLAYNENLPKLF